MMWSLTNPMLIISSCVGPPERVGRVQHCQTVEWCVQTYACVEINTLTRDAIASRRTAIAEAGQEIADLLRASHAALEVRRLSIKAVTLGCFSLAVRC